MKRAVAGMAALAIMVAGCSAAASAPPAAADAAAPTPIIIYVTPPPTASPSAKSKPSPTPTSEPTAAPRPTPTLKPTPKPTPIPTPKPWYGSAYELILADPPVAFRWLKGSEFDCSYSGASCWGMYVIPKDGCSSLYVQLSIEDGNGTVIGSTGDSVGAVKAGQRAKLIFDSFDDAAQSGRVSDVSCY
jgi:hypothetical protein